MASLPPSIQPRSIAALAQSDIVAPPCYLEPAILPVGGQLILASRAKTGKSWIMLEMGRALSSGDIPFRCPEFVVPSPVRVLLAEAELGDFGLKRRVEKIYTDEEIRRQGRNAGNFMYVSKVPELKLDTQKGLQLLYDLCEEVQPHVLMLDPIGRFSNINESDNQEVSKLLSGIDELQKYFAHNNMAVIWSQHMGKPPDQRAGFDTLDPYQIRGASKWFDNVDSVITTERTHDLATKHEAWSVTARFTLRHGESPDDMIFHVNEKADGAVRYHKHKGGPNGGSKLCQLIPKKETAVPVQAGFAPV